MEYTIVDNRTDKVVAKGKLREYTQRTGPHSIRIHAPMTRAYNRLYNLAYKLGINPMYLSIRIV